MSRKKLLIVIGVIIALFGYWYTHLDADTNKASPSTGAGVKIGQTLPPFNLENLDGSQATVGQPGKITVINFWATWCPPCREEMPELETFFLKNQQKVNFYAVNMQESSEKINIFLSNKKYTMPILLDKDGSVGKIFQVTAIPTTIIVNKSGMVKYRKAGAMSRNELEDIINSL